MRKFITISMLTRRHLRIKVMQSLYSFFQNENANLSDQVSFFKKSYLNTFTLYIVILAFFKAIFEHAHQQNDLQKHLRTKTDSNTYRKVMDNKILRFIAEHPVLNNFIKKRKVKFWELDFDYVKTNFNNWVESQPFINYSKISTPTPEDDIAILIHFFKEIMAPSEAFYDYFQDKELTWTDDLPVVNTFLLKQLGKIDPKDSNSLIFPVMNTTDEDPVFAIDLLEKVVVNNDTLQQELVGRTPNWDSDRIALLDAIMIKMALAELLYFSSIPTKVTMNEYIEISKDYSTPKSNVFINGILDKIIKDFSDSGIINKSGRGLI